MDRRNMWQDERYDYVRVGGVVFAFRRDLEAEKEEKRHKTAMQGLKRTQDFLVTGMALFVTFDVLILVYLIGLASNV